MVAVEVAVDVGGDAAVELAQVLLEELVSLCLRDGEALVDIGAGVAVADGPDANDVLVGSEAEALELLDKVEGASNVPCLLRDVEVISVVIIDVVVVVVVIDINFLHRGCLVVMVVVLGESDSGHNEEGCNLHHFLNVFVSKIFNYYKL